MSNWTTPKTDWNGSAEEKFNISDYARIKGNINYIKDQALLLYPASNMNPFEDMGADKTYSCIWRAEDINKIERNLEHIRTGTYPYQTGSTMSYSDNTPFINYIELNRIESALLLIKTSLQSQLLSQKRLAYRFGADRFIQI